MPTLFTIRLALPKDDLAVADLLVASFRDTYAVKMPEVVVNERRVWELRDMAGKRDKGQTWVAQIPSGGAIIGTVFVARPGSKDSLAWLEGFCELKHLAVVPEFRQSGLSGRLMEAAWDGVRSSGAKGLCLHVRRGAKGVAKFYEKQGFQRDPGGDFDRLPEVFLCAYYKWLVP